MISDLLNHDVPRNNKALKEKIKKLTSTQSQDGALNRFFLLMSIAMPQLFSLIQSTVNRYHRNEPVAPLKSFIDRQAEFEHDNIMSLRLGVSIYRLIHNINYAEYSKMVGSVDEMLTFLSEKHKNSHPLAGMIMLLCLAQSSRIIIPWIGKIAEERELANPIYLIAPGDPIHVHASYNPMICADFKYTESRVAEIQKFILTLCEATNNARKTIQNRENAEQTIIETSQRFKKFFNAIFD